MEYFKKGRKGITLIALVVTIIVLLILAGLSISMLTGQNGILNRAGEAKIKSEQAEIREKIRMCALNAISNQLGILKYDNLITELNKEFGDNQYEIDPKDEKASEWTITVNNIEEVVKGKKQPLSSIITPENYGDCVNYSANGIDNWKIFYNDGTNVFLISSDYVDNKKIPNTLGILTDGTYKVCWQQENLIYKNSEEITNNVANKYLFSYKNKYTSDHTNIRVVASLLDTSKWIDFVDKTVAESAIGSPTLEMFCSSWNQKGYGKLYCNNYDERGYFIGGNDNPTTVKYYVDTDNGYHDTLYYPHQEATEDGCLGYLLASPIARDGGCIMRISIYGNINYRHYSVFAEGLRPVICLKSNVIGKKDDYTQIWNLE